MKGANVKNLPDAKQTIRTLRNIAGPIDELEAKRAPLVNQRALMRKNGITSGNQHDKLASDIEKIESELRPLRARRDELEEPFLKARAQAHADIARSKGELARLEESSPHVLSSANLDAKIKENISKLTESGMTEKEARESPLILALEEQRSYLTGPKAVHEGALLEAKGVIDHCDKVLRWKDNPEPISAFESQGFRLVANLGFFVLFALISVAIMALKTKGNAMGLFGIQILVLAYGTYDATLKKLLKGRTAWEEKPARSWTGFMIACTLAVATLGLGLLSDGRGSDMSMLEILAAIASAATCGLMWILLMNSAETEAEAKKRAARTPSTYEPTRGEEIEAGRKKLQRDIEDGFIDYGKK